MFLVLVTRNLKASTQDDKPIAKKDKGVIKLKVNKSSKKGFSNVVLTAISQGLLWAIMAIGGLH